MKKTISIALILIMLMSMCSMAVLADYSETAQPRYVRFSSLETELNMSAAVARYEGAARTMYSSDKVYVTAYLQQKVNNTWVTISSTSANGNMIVSAFGSCSITSGSFFRVRVDAKVYDSNGTLLETATSYSSQKYY